MTEHVAIRHHHLCAIAKSPSHALASLRKDEKEPTRAMDKGTAVHAIVLGTVRVVAAPMARNDKHTAWREFKEAHDGCMIVTQKELDEASFIADAVRRDKFARELIESATHLEGSLYWRERGRQCRVTPDILGNAYVADLKTGADVSPEAFARSAAKYGYHSYLDWCLRAAPDRSTYLIAVETSPPYPVVVYEVEPAALMLGASLNDARLAKLLECERTGAWPGYATEITTLSLPQWAFDVEDDVQDEDEAPAWGFEGAEASP